MGASLLHQHGHCSLGSGLLLLRVACNILACMLHCSILIAKSSYNTVLLFKAILASGRAKSFAMLGFRFNTVVYRYIVTSPENIDSITLFTHLRQRKFAIPAISFKSVILYASVKTRVSIWINYFSRKNRKSGRNVAIFFYI